jgi:hypothetical protein
MSAVLLKGIHAASHASTIFIPVHACPYFLGTCLKVEDYYDDVKMPGSRLKIGFHGDGKTSEQIFTIPFRDGDDVKYFVVRGVSESDRRVTRCHMVRIMDWDQLIEYLEDVWEELWDVMLFKLKATETSMP